MNAFAGRALGAAFAMLFLVVMELAAAERRPLSRRLAPVGALAVLLGLGFGSVRALAAESLTAGAVVRVASESIDAGWQQGRAVLDARQCWMVKLDKPTHNGYTMLALSFLESVEVQRSGVWSSLAL